MSDWATDAEFAAFKVIRLANRETGGPSQAGPIAQAVQDMADRHGTSGVAGLVVALARQCSIALSIAAESMGDDPDDLVDVAERGRLERLFQSNDGDEPDQGGVS